jgi:hypothetical protein
MVPEIVNVSVFFDGGSRSFMSIWMVIGAPGGRSCAFGRGPLIDALSLLSMLGSEGDTDPMDEMVPDGVKEATEPSNEYSGTF